MTDAGAMDETQEQADFDMWIKVMDIGRTLSSDEKSTLRHIGRGRDAAAIPFDHVRRLISTGLVELSMGQLEVTIPGRQLIGVMSGA